MSAFTWLLRRTVPSSRNAKPACMASTITAPIRMNNTSPDVLCSISPPLIVVCGAARPSGARSLAPTPEEGAGRVIQATQLVLDEVARGRRLPRVERGVERAPRIARLAPLRTHLLDQ